MTETGTLPRLWSHARRFLASVWVKTTIALLIVALLVHFNRLDWNALLLLGETWPWLLVAFLLMLPPFAIVSARFQVVLRSQGIKVSFPLAMRWTMVGSFFDLAMPSSNGGDVVKAGYVMQHVGAGMRVRAIAAVGIDRVLGLLGLFLLASLVCLANWSTVQRMAGASFLFVTSFGASIGVLTAFRILGSRRLYNNIWLNQRLQRNSWGLRLRQFIGAFNELRERPAYLAVALALSVVNHMFWCTALLCIARAVGHDVQFAEGFAVFPLAIFGNVFGVAGGFGVGTAAFDLILTQLLGIGDGALIGLVFQTLGAASRLLGLPFFVTSHRDPAIAKSA